MSSAERHKIKGRKAKSISRFKNRKVARKQNLQYTKPLPLKPGMQTGRAKKLILQQPHFHKNTEYRFYYKKLPKIQDVLSATDY